MINYWWVTRPKRKLDSIPETLTMFAAISLNQEWSGSRATHIQYEDALEAAGLKRVGSRRDQGGSGGRTYRAWLESLGLTFIHESTGNVKLTLAGEAIIAGDSPVEVLRNQVLKYQFPSAFSIGRNVNVSSRFKIRPFRFLLRLLTDSRVEYLTQDEIGKIIIVEAENETERCYEHVVSKLLDYRENGDSCLDADFATKYKPSRGPAKPHDPYSHLIDVANTIINWLEYTQLAHRNEARQLVALEDKLDEINAILNTRLPFIDRPESHEYFQRKYGLDPKHRKDTRNLENTKTITERIIAEQKIKHAFVKLSITRPISSITPDLIAEIAAQTGILDTIVEDVLWRTYPHGSIGAFMASYFEMAFKGTEEAIAFEKATTELFSTVFKYNTTHLGQTGSKSAPDILLLSDSDGYQAIIDNKAYSKYSITGDHHNRMVHNYIGKLDTYSHSSYPLAFFSYIAGGFANQIDKQILAEVNESGINGSGITVTNFIKMIERQTASPNTYTHSNLRQLFSLNRQIRLTDLSLDVA